MGTTKVSNGIWLRGSKLHALLAEFDLTAHDSKEGSLAWTTHTFFMRFCVGKNRTPQRRMSLKINLLLQYEDS